MMRSGFVLEICCYNLQSVMNAETGKAARVELCSNPAEGGTTPGYGMVKVARDIFNGELFVMIRPRGGDFVYSDQEHAAMLQDIRTLKGLHIDGIVTGILTSGGKINIVAMKEILNVAGQVHVVFHRAFDFIADPYEAIDTLCNLGVCRILTSGGEKDAYTGRHTLKKYVEYAGNRICIMPGAGIGEDNIRDIAVTTTAAEFHTTAKAEIKSKMKILPGLDDEHQFEASVERIREMSGILSGL
ncbi:MAG: copper homeostasis protein CutC [Bacteroidota bacterium]